jgi:two-component system LytT family response regulator
VTAPIRTVVVDDEPIARARVVALLGDEPDVQVIGEYADGQQALEAIERTTPDLVFLDVQIAELNGLDLARRLGQSPPAIVFVTAYDDYALGAFEVHALDYLLKPFGADRFKAAVSHAREQLARRRATGTRSVVAPGAGFARTEPACDRLIVRSSGRIYFVATSDIDWCEAAGNYIRLHAGARTHFMRETMARLQEVLDPAHFVRIHRSTIVNVDRIQELRSTFNGEYLVLLSDGTRLTLSRGYRHALQTRLGGQF